MPLSLLVWNLIWQETIRKLYDLQAQKGVDPNTKILEKEPFEADESQIRSHKLYKCMDAFLGEHYDAEMMPYCIVSLSGGVDSMVVLKLLLLLKDKYRFEVAALHIDYKNRPESGLEADYVEQWCRKQNGSSPPLINFFLSLVTFKKKVMDLQRATADREWYEKETKYVTHRSISFDFIHSLDVSDSRLMRFSKRSWGLQVEFCSGITKEMSRKISLRIFSKGASPFSPFPAWHRSGLSMVRPFGDRCSCILKM